MKLQQILQEIEDNQSKIAEYGKFDDRVLKKINYKLRLDWNYYSNRMEGGTLTREETRSVMVGNIDVNGKPYKDIAEMKGHDSEVNDVLKMSKGELTLAEKRIKAIHKTIMYEEIEERRNLIGEWKKTNNEIINYKGEKIVFTEPSEVPEQVHKLLDRTNVELEHYRNGKSKLHPVEIAAQFHIDFISIHPFYDGNGRTTRILTNILLIACGYPVIVIKDNHKEAYYRLLADIQLYEGKPDLFYAFIGERVLDTQRLILDALEGKEIDEPDDIDKEIKMAKGLFQGQSPIYEASINSDHVIKLIESVVIPSSKYLYEKLSEFDDEFMNISYNCSVAQGSRVTSGGLSYSIDDLISNIKRLNLVVYEKENLRSILSVEKRHNGLKKHENASNINVCLKFEFKQYFLECIDTSNAQLSAKFAYDQTPDIKVIHNLMNLIIKEFINRLKQMLSL